jgi:hypothetical protein
MTSRLLFVTLAFLAGALAGCGDTSAPENHPPKIGGLPTSLLHDREYHHLLSVTDPDGDSVSVQAVTLPNWLTFHEATLSLRGTPGVEGIGEHDLVIQASDGLTWQRRSFVLSVAPNLASLTYAGPWSHLGFHFGHDGLPFRSENFTVYSGFSSEATRAQIAHALEGHFLDLKGAFDIQSHDELDGWGQETTIPVLALRYQGIDVLWTGQSFRYGLIVHAPDGPRYSREGYTPSLYDQLLRHELMHVLEYYLVGQAGTYYSVEKWFHEGMAMVMGGTPPGQIRLVTQTERWQAEMAQYSGQGNPIAIRWNEDYPTQIQDDADKLGSYYLFFELAVRYLLDEEGFGKGPADVKRIYLDIRRGASFAWAFETHMGLSVAAYRDTFWTLMEEYLQ